MIADMIMKLFLGILLLLCSVQDLLKKKIYLWVVAVGGVLTIACLPFCEGISLVDRLGGCMIGLGVMLLSKATHGKIGMGDGILLCITGLGFGFWGNLELFGIALFVAALVSIFLLIFRLADRKKSIPFIPFLFVGFAVLVFASNSL